LLTIYQAYDCKQTFHVSLKLFIDSLPPYLIIVVLVLVPIYVLTIKKIGKNIMADIGID